LTGAGWTVLGRNVRVGRHELDLVAIDPGPPAVVVVEVRWRSSRAFGSVEETLDWRKQSHLRVAARRIVAAGGLPDGTPLPPFALRIDLVVVEPPVTRGDPPVVRHHRAAVGE
jgi:putative endonuclease